jgi:hypothetical protein
MSKTKPTEPAAEINAEPPRAAIAQRLAAITGHGAVWILERMDANAIDHMAVWLMMESGDNTSALQLLYGDAKAT